MGDIEITAHIELPVRVVAEVEERGHIIIESVWLERDGFEPVDLTNLMTDDEDLHLKDQVSGWIELQWEKQQAMREDAAEARIEQMREREL